MRDQLVATESECSGQSPSVERSAHGSYARLIVDSAEPITDVVFLWPLDANDVESPSRRSEQLNEELLSIVQAVAKRQSAERRRGSEGMRQSDHGVRFWIVTSGAQIAGKGGTPDVAQASLWGFARTLALEHPDWQCKTIDLDPQMDVQQACSTLLDEFVTAAVDDELEIAFRQAERFVRRLESGRNAAPNSGEWETRHLTIGQRGTLDGLQVGWRPRSAPAKHEIELRVQVAGLNFRDVLNVLGRYPGQPPLGAECSGLVTRVGPNVERFRVGDRVIAVAPDCFSEYLTLDASLVVPIPEKLPLADAATLPVAFLTAAFALETLGSLQADDRVLIHAATGGVGLAAIQLAQAAGAEVFATAQHRQTRNAQAAGNRTDLRLAPCWIR